MPDNKEIEVRFREVDVAAVTEKLLAAGFTDHGEELLTEAVFYDADLAWQKERKTRTRYVRVRSGRNGTVVTYKDQRQDIATAEAKEIEYTVNDFQSAVDLFESIGLVCYRRQEKKRHTFSRDHLKAEFDTWPEVPTFIEFEASSEDELKAVTAELGFSWNDVCWENAGNLIEKYYGLMVSTMDIYTFSEIRYKS